MADQKIWSNETGQVLLGAGGMVLRQPFNFERGFTQNENITCFLYIDNPGLIKDYYSISVWKNVNILDTGNYGYIGWPSNFSNGIYRESAGAANRSYIKSEPSGDIPLGAQNQKYRLLSFLRNGNITNAYVNSSVSFTTSLYTPASEIDRIIIGAGGASARLLRNQVVTNIRVFNRPILREEHLFIYANGTGSYPLSRSGLLIDLELNKAEILDFSSNNYTYDPLNVPSDSDFRVGCRDSSGNNKHAYFFGLPSGSLVEKLDWANINLFSDFIQ